MRKVIVLIIALCSISVCKAQLKSKVDERVELTSIVFRIAGMHEYLNNEVSGYAKDIDNYFDKYKKHPLIEFIGEIRRQNGVAYAAVAGSALSIHINDNSVSLSPSTTLQQVIEGNPRWTEETFTKYISLLDDFYKKSHFNSFFKAHSDLYKVAEQNMDRLLGNVNTEWFEGFYGKEFTNPNVYAAVANGSHNYFVGDSDSNAKFAIVIGCLGNEKGLPDVSDSKLSSIIHELTHSFSEPLLQKYWNDIKSASEIIYPNVKEPMKQNAYGSAYEVMAEWLTNLFVIMYFKDNPNPNNHPIIKTYLNTERGFIWMPRSVKFMENFDADREHYKDVSAFMPFIAGFVNATAADFDKVIFEFDNRNPYVISVFPASGITISNISDIAEIKITFSEKMNKWALGYEPIISDNCQFMPIKKAFWRDDYTLIIETDLSIKGNTGQYGFALEQYYILSAENYPLSNNTNIIYNISQNENF